MWSIETPGCGSAAVLVLVFVRFCIAAHLLDARLRLRGRPFSELFLRLSPTLGFYTETRIKNVRSEGGAPNTSENENRNTFSRFDLKYIHSFSHDSFTTSSTEHQPANDTQSLPRSRPVRMTLSSVSQKVSQPTNQNGYQCSSGWAVGGVGGGAKACSGVVEERTSANQLSKDGFTPSGR